MATKKIIKPATKKFSRVTMKPLKAPEKYQKAFEVGAPIPKGVKLDTTMPKPNSYKGV